MCDARAADGRAGDGRACDARASAATGVPTWGVRGVPGGRRCHNAQVPDSRLPDPLTSESSEGGSPGSDTAGPTIPSPVTGDPLSSSAVYVAAPEGDTGKSTVALGLLRILAGTVQRVGLFRPVTVVPRATDPGPGRDRIVEMLLQHTTVDLAYEDCIGVTNVRVHEDRDAALTEIVDRYHAVARQCDVVVILGTDYTGVPSPTEFDFNATVAVNLGAPVLLVIRGADRTPEEIGTNARLTLEELYLEHAHPVGIVVNRCQPDALEAIQGELAHLDLPVWTLPSQALLTAPTMGELKDAVDGTLYSGDPALLDREVMAVMVGGMTGDRILERLVDGMVVIVPADRTDAVLAILTAHAAEGFPSLAGMIWNGGLMPNPAMDRLVHGMRSTLPIICTDHGTYDTARVAADTRINGKFANANIPRLKSMLVDQICQASGGPCTYTGRDMKSTHAGMGVSSGDFDALVGDLVATLNKFKVPEREKNELLGALGPMKGDIVEKPMASMQ